MLGGTIRIYILIFPPMDIRKLSAFDPAMGRYTETFRIIPSYAAKTEDLAKQLQIYCRESYT